MSYVTEGMRASFADHELTCLCMTEHVTVYRMARPATRVMLVQLSFSPEGIAIQGDQRQGFISDCGYDLNWFTKRTHESNLCEKFLTTKWIPSLAHAELLDPDGPYQKSQHKHDIDNLARSVIDGVFGMERTRDDLADLDLVDEFPGYGYDPDEAGWLCLIQQTFRRLYLASLEETGVKTKNPHDSI